MPWILDTDPGVDDAAAVIGALRLPLDLLGITVVHGNVPLEMTLTNTLRLKQLLGSDIPVYAGAAQALLQPPCHAPEIHGADGLGDITWPPLTVAAEQQHAVAFIVEAAKTYAGSLNLLAVGPLTNIALALAMEPSLVDAVERVVIMGGTHSAHGNTSMVGEFNFYADPEAAAMVLRAGWHVEVVPWETTLASLVPLDVLPEVGANPVSDTFRRLSAHLAGRMKRMRGVEGLLMCDFAALAVALDPSVGVDMVKLYGAVETAGQHGRGLLALDYARRFGGAPNLTMYRTLEQESLQQLFRRAFADE